MKLRHHIIERIRVLLGIGILVFGGTAAANVPLPQISQSGNGDYVVSYTACTQCAGHGLEERRPGSNQWRSLGSGSKSFTDQPRGTYRYRVVYALNPMPGQYVVSYSTAVSVVVAEVAAEVPSLTTQLGYEYAAFSGDLDGNGRHDLLLRRGTGSAAAGNGTIGNVLLMQSRGGDLEPVVPSPSQLDVMARWAPAAVEIGKRDVNIDGYVDLVVRGVGEAAGFRRAENQIVFAPGRSGSSAPYARSVDAGLARFSRDIDRHLIDPNFYPKHAPVSLAVIVHYVVDCPWVGGATGLDGYYPWTCFFDPQFVYIAYRDISGFDRDAMEIARTDFAMIHGGISKGSGLNRIRSRIEDVLDVAIGGWEINELLGRKARAGNNATERGMGLFSVLAGISEAVAQETDGTNEPVGPERVLLKGRRVLGQGPFHTALEFRGSTISAFDSDPSITNDGLLVSEVNWPRDHPSLTLRLGYVDGPAVAPIYWGRLLAADRRYDDDLRYDLFPSIGQGGYNSNSYVAGLIDVTRGVPTVQMTTFVGGERPVPPGAFN